MKENSNQPQNKTKIQPSNKVEFSKLFSDSLSSACLAMSVLNPLVDAGELIQNYKNAAKTKAPGDTQDLEAMLMSQARALEFMFNNMLCYSQGVKDLRAKQVYFDIALKAQKQARQTISALADIQQPKRTTFIKQQNNAVNQQINNHNDFENLEKKSSNELLKEVKNETLDGGGTLETILTHPEMETVE